MANLLDAFTTVISTFEMGYGVGKSIETNEWIFGKITWDGHSGIHYVDGVIVYEGSVGKTSDCEIYDQGKTKFFCEGQFVKLTICCGEDYSHIDFGVCKYDSEYGCYVAQKGKTKIVLKRLCNFVHQEMYVYGRNDIWLTPGGYLFDNPNFDAPPKIEIADDIPF